MYCAVLRAPCDQESAWYCINKHWSRLNAGLVLKPDLENQKGNRSGLIFEHTVEPLIKDPPTWKGTPYVRPLYIRDSV